MVHLTALEIARGPGPDMNRQTNTGEVLARQRGAGDLGLARGENTRVCPVEAPSDAYSDRNITYRTRLAKIIVGRDQSN